VPSIMKRLVPPLPRRAHARQYRLTHVVDPRWLWRITGKALVAYIQTSAAGPDEPFMISLTTQKDNFIGTSEASPGSTHQRLGMI